MSRILRLSLPLLLFAQPLFAQTDATVLRALQSVAPLVDVQLPPGAPHDEESLETLLQWAFLLHLETARIPVALESSAATVSISVNAMYREGFYAFSYGIEVQEPAYLLRNVTEEAFGDRYRVTTWRSTGVGQVGRHNLRFGLEDVVGRQLTGQFIDAWQAANQAG